MTPAQPPAERPGVVRRCGKPGRAGGQHPGRACEQCEGAGASYRGPGQQQPRDGDRGSEPSRQHSPPDTVRQGSDTPAADSSRRCAAGQRHDLRRNGHSQPGHAQPARVRERGPHIAGGKHSRPPPVGVYRVRPKLVNPGAPPRPASPGPHAPDGRSIRHRDRATVPGAGRRITWIKRRPLTRLVTRLQRRSRRQTPTQNPSKAC